ncbi:sensor histidine kinase [Lysobacter arvi]|uniref:Histidine kinase n=1 Tax=Lysobacter arvi TaxID=3038776 RepID=A0ABU1CD77_9GAMM|nr:histidine kinase [Lysobacter arvi]MDR0182702.1 histidine kinase [Lysobacter arvi]
MRIRSLPLVLLVTAWWTLNGLVWSGQVLNMREATGQSLDVAQVLRLELASAWLWIPITFGLFACVRRWPLEWSATRTRIAKALVAQASAVALVILARALAVVAFNDAIGWYASLPSFGAVLATSALNNLLMSWMIVGIAHALVYAERARHRERQAMELESRLAQARLEALSAQLNPHFLFNALNSIAEMIHRDADAADRMLVDLGALLRHSLGASQQQEVALREELVALDHYLGIEKLRLGERLRIRWGIDAASLDARVPHLVLQPLVENAIQHAIATRTTPGELCVRAARNEDRLILEVRDDGGAHPAPRGSGIGLRNTRARLACLYGADHLLEIVALVAGGTLVRLDLPYRAAGATP